MFTDEALIHACDPQSIYVRRRQADEWNPDYFVPTIKFGKFSCMVYGGIYLGGRIPLYFYAKGTKVNSEIYCNTLGETTIPIC